MVRLYNLDKLRKMIGEDDTNNVTTNKRLREAGELAQSEYEIETTNITVIVTEKIKEMINFGAIAYFYHLENGDETLTTKYTAMLEKFIKTNFGRPNMITNGRL